MEDDFFSVVQRYITRPGQILNAAMLRKELRWPEAECRLAVERLISLGYCERAGGHFLRITAEGFDHMVPMRHAAE